MDLVALCGIVLAQIPSDFHWTIWPVVISGPVVIALAILYVYLTEWRKKKE
ncbi:MAG: hypothetical protein ACTSRS_00120 [Candidatus Helarchaeota archaeon]